MAASVFAGPQPPGVSQRQRTFIRDTPATVQTAQAGNVLGASSNRSGQGSDFQSLINQTPLEKVDDSSRGESEQLINESFAPALQALGQFSSQLQAQLPNQIAAEQERGEALKGQARGEEQSRLQEFGRQRNEAQQSTTSAINEARRQAAELQQGIQARFGGTTGTGGFVSELLGREALRNISGNRQALQQTLSQIAQAEADLKNRTSALVNNIDLSTRDAVNQLQSNLINSLKDINLARGELEAQKADRKLDLLKEFREARRAVEQRNTEMKQELFQQFQKAQGALRDFKEKEQETFLTTLERFSEAGFEPIDATTGEPFLVSPDMLSGSVPQGARFRRVPDEKETNDIGTLGSFEDL